MALHTMLCHECGQPFEAVRSDAEVCSTRCRVRRFRRAERERAARRVDDAERAAILLAALAASVGDDAARGPGGGLSA